MNDMQKAKIVQNVLGKILEPYGFTYNGYDYRTWELKRVVDNNVEQYVLIYKSGYDKSLRLELCTSVRSMHLCTKEITDDPKYAKQFIEYEDDNDFANILKLFGEFVIEYGLKKLDEISVQTLWFEPDEQMYTELYNNHLELANSFMMTNNIERDNTLEETFIIIESIIEDREKKKEFNDSNKKMLLEMVAYFCDEIIKGYGGIWEWDVNYNQCHVNYINEKFNHWDFLKLFINAWEKSEIKVIKYFYGRICY
jgi:hypothetical protein